NSNATVREILTSGALSGLLDGSLVVLYLLLMCLIDRKMALLVFGLGALQVLVFVASRRAQRDLNARSLHVQAKTQGYEVEMFAGIETLKAMGAEQRSVEHWSNRFADVLNVSLAKGRLTAKIESLNSTLRLMSPLAILAFGAVEVTGGEITLGTMLALS